MFIIIFVNAIDIEYFLENEWMIDKGAFGKLLLMIFWNKVHFRIYYDVIDTFEIFMLLYSIYVSYWGIWMKSGLSKTIKQSVFLK